MPVPGEMPDTSSVGKNSPQPGSMHEVLSRMQESLSAIESQAFRICKPDGRQDKSVPGSIGLAITGIEISGLMPCGPAYISGQLDIGDEIVSIDGNEVTPSNVVEFISGFENSDIKVVVRKAGSGAELEVHLVRASSTKLLATHLLWDSLRQLQEEDVKDPEDVTSGIERCRELLERLNAVITQRDTEYRARLVEARRNIGVGLADARDVLRMAMAMTESSSWGGGRLANAGESETSRLAEQCQQLKSRLIQEDEARQGLEAEIDSLKILGMNPSPPHKKVQEQSKTIEALQGQVQQLQLRLMQAETERGQLMKVASEEMTNPEIDESVSKSKLLGRMEKQADLINALKGELQKASSQGMRQSQEIESLRRSSTSFGSNDPQEQQQQSRSVLAIEVERLNRLLQGVKEKSEVCRMKLEGELIEAKSKHMLMETELEQAVQKYVTLLGEKDDLVLDLKTAGIRLEQLNLKFEEQQRLAQDHSRLLRQRIAALEATTSAAHVPLPPIPDLNPSVSDDPMGIKELVASIDSVLTPRNQSLQGNVSLRGSQLAALSSFDVVHPHDSGGKNANESVASSGNVVDEDRDVKPPGQDLEERLGCDGRTLVIGKDDVRNADPTVLGGIQALAEHAVKMEARNDVKKGGGEQVDKLRGMSEGKPDSSQRHLQQQQQQQQQQQPLLTPRGADRPLRYAPVISPRAQPQSQINSNLQHSNTRADSFHGQTNYTRFDSPVSQMYSRHQSQQHPSYSPRFQARPLQPQPQQQQQQIGRGTVDNHGLGASRYYIPQNELKTSSSSAQVSQAHEPQPLKSWQSASSKYSQGGSRPMSYSRDPSASVSSSHVEMGSAPRPALFASNPLASKSSSQVEMSSPRISTPQFDLNSNSRQTRMADGRHHHHHHHHQQQQQHGYHNPSLWAIAAQEVASSDGAAKTPRGQQPILTPRRGQGQTPILTPRSHQEAIKSPRAPVHTPRSHQHPIGAPQGYQSAGTWQSSEEDGRHSFNEASAPRESHSGGAHSQIMFGSPIRETNSGHVTTTVGPLQSYIPMNISPRQSIQQIQGPYIIASSRGNMMF